MFFYLLKHSNIIFSAFMLKIIELITLFLLFIILMEKNKKKTINNLL